MPDLQFTKEYPDLAPELVAEFRRFDLVVVEEKPEGEKRFRARLAANDAGPWFEGVTVEDAVSVAWGFGFHHTADTEAAAVVEAVVRMGEKFVLETGADAATVYGMVRQEIEHLDPAVYEAWPDDCFTLTAEHEKSLATESATSDGEDIDEEACAGALLEAFVGAHGVDAEGPASPPAFREGEETDSLLHFMPGAFESECGKSASHVPTENRVTLLVDWANADRNRQCRGCLARVSKRTGGLQSWES